MRINMDNIVLVGMTKTFDCVVASFYFLICCIPIFTIGAALTAISGTMMAIHRNEYGGVTKKFFGLFKSEFKIATKAWGIMLLVGLVVVADVLVCFVLAQNASMVRSVVRGLTIAAVLLYSSVMVYLFAGISRFVVSLKQAFQNAILFAAKNIGSTVLLVFLMFFNIAVCYLTWFLGWPLVVLGMFLQGTVLCRVFRPYMPETEEFVDNRGDANYHE